MTDEEKLTALKLMVDESESDDVLRVYLDMAGRSIIAKAFPYKNDVTEVPEKYAYIQVKVAAYLINKRGAEGELSHSENGVTRSYECGDVPTSLLRDITPTVGVI